MLTRSFDNARTGANTQETILTPAVVAAGLHKRFSLQVPEDARLEAQPLIVPDVALSNGVRHDVVYVCSMGNAVHAFDATTGASLWPRPVQLGRPVDRSLAIDRFGINTHWGILGTPVVDPETQTLYLVNVSSTDGTLRHAVHQLHALDLSDGHARHAPLKLQASVAGRIPQATFQSSSQKQRCGLLLIKTGPPGSAHKTLIVACGTGDAHDGSLHGWVLAFDLAAFRHTAAWCTTPSLGGAGIWQAGQGPAADADGNIYLMTGNGDWDGVANFGESFVKLGYAPPTTLTGQGRLTVTDWFTPFRDDQRGPNFQDQDLGSGGPVLLSALNLVVGAGKDGVLYVLDPANLGKSLGDPNHTVLKSRPIFVTYFPFRDPAAGLDFDFDGKSHHLHGSPVFWNSQNPGPMLYCWGENENLRAWTVQASGAVTFRAKSLAVASDGLPLPGGMPGGMLALSANGQTADTGIVWATAPIHGDANRNVVEGIVRAYDATAFGPPNPDGTPSLKLLWDSSKIPGNHFNFSKFCPPVIWNGTVYVTTYDGRVDVYTP